MTPDQFNIDVQQINPLDFGEGTEELEARRAEAAAEEQMQAQQQAGTAEQAQQKDEAFATGGRNDPQQPTSDDGTLDYLQTTPDEQRAEGVKKSTEEKTIGEATKDMVVGAGLDVVENFWTAIPRGIDMLTGKADKEGDQYRPAGMFFDEENNIDYNPITQQTSWGKLGRDALSFLGTGAVIAGGVALVAAAAPAIGLGAGVAGVLSAIGIGARGVKLAALAGKTTAFLGGTGMLTDAVHMNSADHNMMGAAGQTQWIQNATKKYPFLWNPLATSDTDSIFTKTWKNVLEGGMMGGILGQTIGLLGARKHAANVAEGVVGTKPAREIVNATPEKQIADELWQQRANKLA